MCPFYQLALQFTTLHFCLPSLLYQITSQFTTLLFCFTSSLFTSVIYLDLLHQNTRILPHGESRWAAGWGAFQDRAWWEGSHLNDNYPAWSVIKITTQIRGHSHSPFLGSADVYTVVFGHTHCLLSSEFYSFRVFKTTDIQDGSDVHPVHQGKGETIFLKEEGQRPPAGGAIMGRDGGPRVETCVPPGRSDIPEAWHFPMVGRSEEDNPDWPDGPVGRGMRRGLIEEICKIPGSGPSIQG